MVFILVATLFYHWGSSGSVRAQQTPQPAEPVGERNAEHRPDLPDGRAVDYRSSLPFRWPTRVEDTGTGVIVNETHDLDRVARRQGRRSHPRDLCRRDLVCRDDLRESDPTMDIATLAPATLPSIVVPAVLGSSTRLAVRQRDCHRQPARPDRVPRPKASSPASAVRRGTRQCAPVRADSVRRRGQSRQFRWSTAEQQGRDDRHRRRTRQPNLLLADEINRAPAKVQSALLEVMQERRSHRPETHSVPRPFLVMATQNPIESEGTYPLPEAAVDRFMMKVLVDYPSRDRGVRDRRAGDRARTGGRVRIIDLTRRARCRRGRHRYTSIRR